ncbi:hypothetical protein [Planctopirus ephydatiae]|nr:hypothetical protein [Planctopirus ephydatiae]
MLARSRNHRTKNNYSINSIPRMILIGRNFEVISINARGQAFEELLKKEFPGVELPSEIEPESEEVTDTL